MIQPKTDNEWTHLRLQDYKSIWYYSHVVYKICAINKHMKNKSKGQSLEKGTNFISP
jgi:hypothetical protein